MGQVGAGRKDARTKFRGRFIYYMPVAWKTPADTSQQQWIQITTCLDIKYSKNSSLMDLNKGISVVRAKTCDHFGSSLTSATAFLTTLVTSVCFSPAAVRPD